MKSRHRRDKPFKSRKHDDTTDTSIRVDNGPLPPDGLPVYRLLTGKDDAEFCKKVSDALTLGYKLYGSPSVTFNGADVIAAQAVLWWEHALIRYDYDDEFPF